MTTDRTDPPDSDRAAWLGRQARLPVELHGEVLEPAEVRFVERFVARGQSIEWIPSRLELNDAGGYLPTNDFSWLNRGRVAIELKSPAARYSTIKASVQDAVNEAAAQGVVKDRFVIDLGRARLTDTLRAQLSRYNQRVRSGRIRELWVLSHDGMCLERIELR